MDAYVIVGRPNTRKSTIMRSLTGIHNRGRRDIALLDGMRIEVYARVSSLQESRTTPSEFVREVSQQRCDAVAFCLWPDANFQSPNDFPDAHSYLRMFRDAGWNIVRVAVLGQAVSEPSYPNVEFFPTSQSAPVNQTAQGVRRHFGWF